MREYTNKHDFYDQAHEWSRHYDSTLWTVTSIFTVANSALLTYFYNENIDYKLSILGIILTLISFFFAASFRALRRKLNEYLESHGANTDIQYLRSPNPKFKQWRVYLFIHFIFLSFWFEKIDNKTIIWWILLILSIAIVVFYYRAADKIELSGETQKKKLWQILKSYITYEYVWVIFFMAFGLTCLIFHTCAFE